MAATESLESANFLTKFRVEIKYGLTTVVLLGLLLLLQRVDALAPLNDAINDFIDLMIELDFIGVFILAAVGNSILMVQVPYTFPVLVAASNGRSLEYMIALGLIAGVGATIGEFASYILADKVLARNPDLEKSKLYQWVKRNVDNRPRLIPAVIFIGAVSILPDDAILVPLAMVRYGLRKITVPLFLGKLLHNVFFATVFFYSTDFGSRFVSTDVRIDVVVGLLIIFVMVIFYQIEKVKTFQKTPEAAA